MEINKTSLKDIEKEFFVTIPGGSVQMRDDRTKENWSATIKPFLLSKYALSQDLYQKIIADNPSTFKSPKRPVEGVSWLESVQYCNALSEVLGKEKAYQIDLSTDMVSLIEGAKGFRLPTEAEWQYACQAGVKGPRYDSLSKIAWYKDNSQKQTWEVGLKEPNAWGLYDMIGNVWEWCHDIYDQEEYGSYRVFRGGGWNDEARNAMATTRRRSHPKAFKIDDLGFRLALNSL